MSKRHNERCRRCAGIGPLGVLALALAVGCSEAGGESGPDDGGPGANDAGESGPGEEARETAAGITQRATMAERYYQAYLDEVLEGDFARARRVYREVVDTRGVPPDVAARAAMRLAEFEAEAGRRHLALELVARAASLGREHRDILHRAERLQRRLAAVRVQDIEVRGPPAGTELEGVSDEARDLFGRAENLLASYHARRLRPRLEDLRAGVRHKRGALDAAVRAYRQVVALGEPVATVAAEFRIASLYYDLSLSMIFDLPPELEASAAADLRRSLRAQALSDRDRARAAYLRALEAGRSEAAGPGAKVWLEAAELGLRSVEDLLGRRE